MSNEGMPLQPVYSKSAYQPQWEYHQMSWDIFLTMREWAQEVADVEGYPVYLVGSALSRTYPRDIDLSIVMPLAAFEARYGELPRGDGELAGEQLKAYIARSEYWHSWSQYRMVLESRIRYAFRCDVKIQPDAWFTDRDKLLLAEPGKGKPHINWRPMKQPEPKEDEHGG